MVLEKAKFAWIYRYLVEEVYRIREVLEVGWGLL